MAHSSSQRAFTCTMCGRCCRRPGQVEVSRPEAARIARALGAEFETFARQHLRKVLGGWVIEVGEGEACPLLRDEKCRVHQVKPLQCRTYPFWPEIVSDDDAWADEALECPGIGQGPHHSPSEVEALWAQAHKTKP